MQASHPGPGLDHPVFVVGPPGCGLDPVARRLARAGALPTAAAAAVGRLDGVEAFDPARRGWDGNRLRASDAGTEPVAALRRHLERVLGGASAAEERPSTGLPADAEGWAVLPMPAGSVQVPLLARAYPDARFVVVHREPEDCLAELLARWRGQREVSYPDLPGWSGPAWSLELTPQWRSSAGRPLVEVVAQQWRTATEVLLADLEQLAPERYVVVDPRAGDGDPGAPLRRVAEALGRPLGRPLDVALGLGSDAAPEPSTGGPASPAPGDRRAELGGVLAGCESLAARLRELADRPVAGRSAAGGGAHPGDRLRSRSAANFGPVLRALGSSLMVSTYQSGYVVTLRELDGGLNTHFRAADAPMGLTYDRGRLVVGTRAAVREWRNVPASIARLEQPDRHDACFVPWRVDHTGDIRVHDVALVGGEVWCVATRFSCLATLDDEHSFVPRWRPSFVSDIAAEDRCHLNGMAVRDGVVRWVTALGVSDSPGGWRARKADGGVVIDVTTDELVAEGLSMPHSPRWYRDRLWVLESGQGSLATVDLVSGAVETVIELPGFTRGLAFAGPLAFIGLSEVREALTFGGIPLTGRLEERECGVWVVNIETGTVVSKLRFEGAVEEIFDVCLLPGLGFPELLEPESVLGATTFVLPPVATGVRHAPAPPRHPTAARVRTVR